MRVGEMTQRRAALLKCRTADRFNARTSPEFKHAPPAEAKEEQQAARVPVPRELYLDLQLDGLIEWRNGWRLTEAGRDELRGDRK